MLLLALQAAPAGAVKIQRMSPPPLDLEVTLPGRSPAISADGRFVAFVVEDGDIYMQDRQTGKTELVSVTPSGAPANGISYSQSISADGRFVAFGSGASNLVPGDTNNHGDIFVRDRQAGKTELVSVAADGGPANGHSYSSPPAISADGRFVAFVSFASNLVPGDTRGGLFVRDRQSGRTERVGDGSQPAISGDSRFVASTNGGIFVWDRQTRKTELVSVGASGAPANGYSSTPSMSADGRFVAFTSAANNLVPGDTNDKLDVFVAERE